MPAMNATRTHTTPDTDCTHTDSVAVGEHIRQSLRATKRWRNRHHTSKALPFVLWDADALRDLCNGEMLARHHDAQAAFLPMQVLDTLAQPGKSTLIIPRKVFNEVMRYENHAADGSITYGSYDFYHRDDGVLDVCTQKKSLAFAETAALADWLDDIRNRGLLRCYRTMHDMRDAGELNSPRGGVVIVDTDRPNEVQPPSHKGVHFLRAVIAGAPKDDALITFDDTRKNAGDGALGALARFIYKSATRTQHKGGLLVISNDTECKKRIGHMCENHDRQKGLQPATQTALSSLIHTMEYQALMTPDANQNVVEAMMKSRIRTADSASHAARASYNSGSPSYMNQCLNWLEATRIAPREHQRSR